MKRKPNLGLETILNYEELCKQRDQWMESLQDARDDKIELHDEMNVVTSLGQEADVIREEIATSREEIAAMNVRLHWLVGEAKERRAYIKRQQNLFKKNRDAQMKWLADQINGVNAKILQYPRDTSTSKPQAEPLTEEQIDRHMTDYMRSCDRASRS